MSWFARQARFWGHDALATLLSSGAAAPPATSNRPTPVAAAPVADVAASTAATGLGHIHFFAGSQLNRCVNRC